MTGGRELQARIRDFFTFSRQELITIFIAAVATALIFSFRDWGDDVFDAALGIVHLFIAFLVAMFSFVGRLSAQKVYALSQGYKAEFRLWWVGIAIALLVAFISMGSFPIVLIGGVVLGLMVRQRLGEFRYGFSYFDNAVVAFVGVLANILLALFFAVGLYFFSDSYFFLKGLWLNLSMAFGALIPLPQLDGFNIYFGSKTLYFFGWLLTLVSAVLLLTQTKIGLIFMVVSFALALIVNLFISP